MARKSFDHPGDQGSVMPIRVDEGKVLGLVLAWIFSVHEITVIDPPVPDETTDDGSILLGEDAQAFFWRNRGWIEKLEWHWRRWHE